MCAHIYIHTRRLSIAFEKEEKYYGILSFYMTRLR